jgi:DnaJ-class molecular chaperone
LADALFGFELPLKLLDGRNAKVKPSSSGHIIENESVQVIKGEGMPLSPGSSRRGDLYIKFNVITPKIGFLKQGDVVRADNSAY